MDMTTPTRQQGISLIEALVAALILAVAILALTGLQVTTLSDSGQSRLNTHALNFAEEKIEELRNFSDYSGYAALSGGSDTEASPSATLNRTWTVTDCPNAATCREVNVTVTWNDNTGTLQTVQLTSYISEDDPVKGGAAVLTF